MSYIRSKGTSVLFGPFVKCALPCVAPSASMSANFEAVQVQHQFWLVQLRHHAIVQKPKRLPRPDRLSTLKHMLRKLRGNGLSTMCACTPAPSSPLSAGAAPRQKRMTETQTCWPRASQAPRRTASAGASASASRASPRGSIPRALGRRPTPSAGCQSTSGPTSSGGRRARLARQAPPCEAHRCGALAGAGIVRSMWPVYMYCSLASCHCVAMLPACSVLCASVLLHARLSAFSSH